MNRLHLIILIVLEYVLISYFVQEKLKREINYSKLNKIQFYFQLQLYGMPEKLSGLFTYRLDGTRKYASIYSKMYYKIESPRVPSKVQTYHPSGWYEKIRQYLF